MNAADSGGRTALIEASAAGQTATVRTLLEAGADLDARDENGRTAWTYAAMANNIGVVRLFQELRGPRTPDPEDGIDRCR